MSKNVYIHLLETHRIALSNLMMHQNRMRFISIYIFNKSPTDVHHADAIYIMRLKTDRCKRIDTFKMSATIKHWLICGDDAWFPLLLNSISIVQSLHRKSVSLDGFCSPNACRHIVNGCFQSFVRTAEPLFQRATRLVILIHLNQSIDILSLIAK